ncbi:hypothetical protein MAR_023026 [Mya arenaria]|uniref:Uncharacterized protein n=1 Tax=Mya arenaria TaxID=6604 RepID=A0ABY7DRD1_MYAAR|nr:hypothetical protein MAR_023026 [Mya arenaria]
MDVQHTIARMCKTDKNGSLGRSGAAAKDEHGVVEESGWSSLLENMDTDIIRNVIDYHPSETDICKANAPLEDAVGDCDVPSTSGFVPSKEPAYA